MIKLTVNANDKKAKINKEIYGHFSEHLGRCIYEGSYVGENSVIPNTKGIRNDVLEALRNIKVPVLRWPGGCFADEYHWKDGIGEKSDRKKMINTHWGGVVEDNSFGTHEFMELCELLGCEPYIAGNLGSGTVQELSEWIEYMTFDGVSPMAELRRKNGREKPWKLRYLGIGNESWGCGGDMRPEFYGDLYRRYAIYCRNYSGNELFKVACGPNADDYNWTRVIMQNVGPWHTKAISLHYYTVPTGDWNKKGSATDFSDSEYYATIRSTYKMEELLRRHKAIMTEYDPENKVGLIVDEWGAWYDVEPGTNPGFLYQQNTMRDAIIASVNLNMFNQNSDRVIMANVAQAVNVLQAVILTEGERMLKTPTYHVFDMYKEHQDAELIYSHAQRVEQEGVNMLSHSASIKDGKMLLTVSNASLDTPVELECNIVDFDFNSIDAKILSCDARQYNTFDNPENVTIKALSGVEKTANGIKLTLPACSVVSVTLS